MLAGYCLDATAQRQKVWLRDSLDGAIDLSDYIIDAHGFVPVPIIITEPALGGFGFGLVPVFLQKKTPMIDSIGDSVKVTFVPPDITGGAGFYTLNNTWGALAFRQGTLVNKRIKYTVASGYSSINLSFYRSIGQAGEKAFSFDLEAIPIYLQGTKRIGTSNWYAGGKYLFLKTDVVYTGDPLLPPAFVQPQEFNSIISQLGAIIELDTRNNIFTPDKGIKVHFDINVSDNVLGSDFDYRKLNLYSYGYTGLSNKLVGGLRTDFQHAFGKPPFFMLPYLELRGAPIFRYQGTSTLLAEAEARWDFIRRWSITMFSGAGKAFGDEAEAGTTDLVITYGAGFRYLIARKFGLRMGFDFAKGPDTWAYYIVFGSSWLK